MASDPIEFLAGPLSPAAVDELIDDVAAVAARARGWQTADELAGFRADYKLGPLLAADVVALARKGGRLLGVCTFRFLRPGPHPVLHLSNAAFLPEAQRQGLIMPMIRGALVRSPDRPCRYLTTITQSPVVYLASSHHGAMHPRLDGTPGPEPMPTLAAFIAAEINPGLPFDRERSVLREECRFRYREVPRSGDPAIDALFDGRLRYDRGDVMITVQDLGLARALAEAGLS